MTTATFPQAPAPSVSSAAPHRTHKIGDAVRAAKVLAGAAFSVVVMGEFAEDAGVRRRSR
ncbi:hypothetical protein ABR738_22835 [Streptomyces sp. Edi4]|uniref:hypothetical protein n=1 Tax=Streptomyces sp. Edi4 TaxID=3162527 RepID=UPI0033063479